EPFHCLQAMQSVRGPKTRLWGRDSNDRIEKHTGTIDHCGKLLVMRVRKIALERCRLNAIDRQSGQQQGLATERLVVTCEQRAALWLDPLGGRRCLSRKSL